LIPRGRLLAGVNVSRGETDNAGQAEVVNEPYAAIAVPGTFTLRQQNVEPGSIAVFLKSPLPPFEIIRLEENVHYTVTPVLNTFDIHLLTLPPQFVVPGTYDLLLSYGLLGGDFELRTDTYGASISTQLFDDLLTPYFSYAAVRSDVLSGVFPGSAIDSTTYTAGLMFYRGPLRGRGEYQELDWEVAPYRAWRAEVQYVSALSQTLSAYASAAYLNKYYPHGTSEVFQGAFTEESESVSGNLQKQFPTRDLSVSAGGSYTHTEGLIRSDAYSVHAMLTWRIGKVDITLGVNAYEVDTTGTNTVPNRRDHELAYVKIRRQLLPW
jgi:hypothetical protein